MALTPRSQVRAVTGISADEEAAMRAFLQGAVYGHIKTQGRKPFAARDLVGGVNFDWSRTPLGLLYEKHLSRGKNNADAIRGAGRDLGWLLKSVLDRDTRTFFPSKARLVSHYEWDGR